MRFAEGRIERACASKKFGRYKGEIELPRRKLVLKSNKNVEALIESWKEFSRFAAREPFKNYEDAQRIAKRLTYSARDIEFLTIFLQDSEFEPKHASGHPNRFGTFISALINEGKDKDYVIHPVKFDETDQIGYMNVKNVLITGPIRSLLGNGMRGGKIFVKGSVGATAGCRMGGGKMIIDGDADFGPGSEMSGGILIVKGNAAGIVGDQMSGGKLIIEGNAGIKVGSNMLGGEIHVNGEFESLGEIHGGKIFHKGKLILEK